MADPLSDPRADDLLNADCGEIATVLRVISTIHDQTHQCVTVLGQVGSTPTWTGDAADAARSSIQSLSPKLKQIGHGYQETAQALTTYYNVVSDVQPKFKALKQQIETTQSTLTSLNQTYSSQQASLNIDLGYEKSAFAPTKKQVEKMNTAVTNDQSDLTATSTSITNAQSDLSTLQTSGMQMLQTFSDARDAVTSRVSGVSGHAPQESSWDTFLHGVENVVGDGVHFFEGIGDTIYRSVTSLPGDIDKIYQDPGDLSAWGKFGEDAAVTLSTAAALTGLGAGALGFVGADGALATGLDSTAGTLESVSGAVNTADAGVEAAEGHERTAALDLLFGRFKASNAAGIGEDTVTAAEKAEAGSAAYAKALGEFDDNPAAAYRSLTAEQRAGLDSTGSVPLTTGQATTLAETTEEATKLARQKLNLAGRPLDVGMDNGPEHQLKEHDGDPSDDEDDDGAGDADGEPSGDRQAVAAAAH